jgi:hypothetical protein
MIRENKISNSEVLERLQYENKIYYKEILLLLKTYGYESIDIEELIYKLKERGMNSFSKISDESEYNTIT